MRLVSTCVLLRRMLVCEQQQKYCGYSSHRNGQAADPTSVTPAKPNQYQASSPCWGCMGVLYKRGASVHSVIEQGKLRLHQLAIQEWYGFFFACQFASVAYSTASSMVWLNGMA